MHDLARSAVLEVADSVTHVGSFIDEESLDGVRVLRFVSLHPGYPGWHWSVSVVGDEPSLTVNEIWMEPGEGALPVPVWKPWSERIRPGDLGAGDVVPTAPDDARLEPGYAHVDLEGVLPPQWEVGLGRERVLSADGLADAAERWRSGDDGPESPVARLADLQCSTCAWLLPIGGILGQAFGVCAHDMSPSDGHIVAMDHGCGAHSDVVAEPSPIPVSALLIDETEYLPVSRGSAVPAQPVAALGDESSANKPEDDARPGDVTPPEGIVFDEEAAE